MTKNIHYIRRVILTYSLTMKRISNAELKQLIDMICSHEIENIYKPEFFKFLLDSQQVMASQMNVDLIKEDVVQRIKDELDMLNYTPQYVIIYVSLSEASVGTDYPSKFIDDLGNYFEGKRLKVSLIVNDLVYPDVDKILLVANDDWK